MDISKILLRHIDALLSGLTMDAPSMATQWDQVWRCAIFGVLGPIRSRLRKVGIMMKCALCAIRGMFTMELVALRQEADAVTV